MIRNISILMIGLGLFSSCSLLDITPEDVVSQEQAFNDVESYQMALNNLYLTLTSSVMNMQTTDFASDDFESVIPGYAESNYLIYNWDYKTQPQPYIWTYQYQIISRANVLIDNYTTVPVSTQEEQDEMDQIYAQALGVRAWSLFNTVQVYAARYDGSNGNEDGIPLKLHLTLEYLPKSSLEKVYGQIYSDLNQAESLLSESDYSASSNYEFGTKAIWALQARVALFISDYETAREASGHFINTELLDKENYWMLWEDQFGSLNKEVIFMTHDLSDTDDADLIDYHEIYENNSVRLSQYFIDSFEEGDIRKDENYINSSQMPYKYIVPVNERNSVVDRNLNYKHFRLAEQYLIYAESVLESNPSEALRVINILRQKRGASLLQTAPDLTQIQQERRRELFTEGLRFYDLKRLSSQLNIVVQRSNGNVLSPNSPLYIWNVPKEETNSNPYID
nr:RagB/SusD family nutrient uptake outer membrane protein [uncultured Carboxylicivirga sp.]